MLQEERNFFKAAIMEQKEEIPLLFEIREEGDHAFKSHIEDAVENAKIKAAQDEDSLPITEGLKEELVHHVFIDPVVEYMKALICSNSPALILCQGRIHQEWSPLMMIVFLKNHMQNTLWLSLTGSQCSFPFLLLLDWLHWHYCIT